MYVYNKMSTNQGMVMHLNKTHIGMAYNHLDYHKYTGLIKKHNNTKEIKSIIYQLMPICFVILRLQSFIL